MHEARLGLRQAPSEAPVPERKQATTPVERARRTGLTPNARGPVRVAKVITSVKDYRGNAASEPATNEASGVAFRTHRILAFLRPGAGLVREIRSLRTPLLPRAQEEVSDIDIGRLRSGLPSGCCLSSGRYGRLAAGAGHASRPPAMRSPSAFRPRPAGVRTAVERTDGCGLSWEARAGSRPATS